MAYSVSESYDYCRALARQTAHNFYYSFLALPRSRLRAMCVLYSFMRVTDDLGDSDQAAAVRAAELAHWQKSLVRACHNGPCDHPVLPALVEVIRNYQIPLEYLLDVIAGVEMDLEPVEFATFDRLADYCYHVAGAVGLACIHLWGFHDNRARQAAVDCGTAFQLTNILRDLGEDADKGRVYLPGEDLDRFGLCAGDIIRDCRGERFARLMQFEVSRAREYYVRAQPLYDYLDAPGKPILEAMLRIYGGLLDEIERRGYDVFTRRVELSRWRKICVAAHSIARHKFYSVFRAF
ncbi:MAG TPA: phytoene/squalene synthase family protein [Planctomycetaceae bacterium]|nr:phytoene/squalene synthase family protein [Planctomycetaceae bacterium]